MPKKRDSTKPISKPATLAILATGVPGLDEVLGGGLPALSFNLVAGGPGAGKTTLAMQVLFANATPERPGLFITLLGETSLKMLRYQQQFDFFDLTRVGKDIHFLNLSDEALQDGLQGVLSQIIEEVETLQPGFVVVDSFRSLIRKHGIDASDQQLDHFVQRLGLQLTTWEITSFLVGEYDEQELRNPVFTVADGILWLSQAVDRNSVVRKLQVVKMRGRAMMPGLHTMRITEHGVQVFPRIPDVTRDVRDRGSHRISTGIAGLDEMMGGGIPSGDSVVLAGPTGTGKTTFALQFVAEGLRSKEAAVIAVFEEHPKVYLQRAKSIGTDFDTAVQSDRLRILYLRPLDLSVDEALEAIRESVMAIGASRVVVDSISGFEMALAPTFRSDFRESFYRLIGNLTSLGVTIFSTVEVVERNEGLQLTGYQVSFLTDDILSQRYVEIDGELRKVLSVVKMRGSSHTREFRAYEITGNGVLLRESLRGYSAIISGMPVRQPVFYDAAHPGLVPQEVMILEAVIRIGPETIETIARKVGLDARVIEPILARLLELNYITREGARYRGVAQPRGP